MKKDHPSETKSSDTVKAPAGKLEGVCHQCHQPDHYRMECPEWQKKKETEATAGAVSRCVRSRDSSGRRSEDEESPSFFVRPIRSRRDQRPIKMMNKAPVPSAKSDSTGKALSASFDMTLPSRPSVCHPSSRQGDKSSETTTSNGIGLAKEWLDYMRKYPPPPVVPPVQPDCWVPPVQPEHGVPPVQPEHWVPPVQPEHWVPPVQPEHWVPPVQPEHWVPPVQPEHRVAATQPKVPSTQPVDGTLKQRFDKESKKKFKQSV